MSFISNFLNKAQNAINSLKQSTPTWVKQLVKGLAIAAIAATGIGLAYLYAKTFTVKKGYQGVTYNHGDLELLGPGVYCLLDPLHEIEGEIGYDREEVVSLAAMDVRDINGVEVTVQANYNFKIIDATKALTKGEKDYREGVNKKVQGAISSILQQHDYTQFTTAQVSHLSQAPTHLHLPDLDLDRVESETKKTEATRASISYSPHAKPEIFEYIKTSLVANLSKLGILISEFRLLNVHAKDEGIRKKIAELNLARLEAERQKIMTTANESTIKAISAAKVAAANYAAKNLTTPEARKIYQANLNLDGMRAISNAKTLVLNSGGSSAAPFTLWSANSSALLARQNTGDVTPPEDFEPSHNHHESQSQSDEDKRLKALNYTSPTHSK